MQHRNFPRDLRLEIRAKNNPLWKAIYSKHRSVAQFCRTHGLNPTEVGALLNFKKSYLKPDGGLAESARRLCEILRLPAWKLFPEKLYSRIKSNFVSLEINAEKCLEWQQSHPLDHIDPEREAERSILAVEVDRVLSTLKDRERQVIRARFGMESGYPKTLKECGDILGVQKERVRQIEAKAIKKLRHPSRTSALRRIVDGDLSQAVKTDAT